MFCLRCRLYCWVCYVGCFSQQLRDTNCNSFFCSLFYSNQMPKANFICLGVALAWSCKQTELTYGWKAAVTAPSGLVRAAEVLLQWNWCESYLFDTPYELAGEMQLTTCNQHMAGEIISSSTTLSIHTEPILLNHHCSH